MMNLRERGVDVGSLKLVLFVGNDSQAEEELNGIDRVQFDMR